MADGSYPPRPRMRVYRACWDCEAPMLCAAPGTVFCDTCAKHRERAHAPVAIFTTDIGRLNSDRNNERAEPKAEFCHGAGPAGTAYDLLEQVPYPLTIRLGEGKFNRMYYREAA